MTSHPPHITGHQGSNQRVYRACYRTLIQKHVGWLEKLESRSWIIGKEKQNKFMVLSTRAQASLYTGPVTGPWYKIMLTNLKSWKPSWKIGKQYLLHYDRTLNFSQTVYLSILKVRLLNKFMIPRTQLFPTLLQIYCNHACSVGHRAWNFAKLGPNGRLRMAKVC